MCDFKMMKRWACRAMLALPIFLSGLKSELAAVPAKLGDVDEDGVASVLDIVAIINHIQGRVPFVEDRISFADLNRDGIITHADVREIVNHIIQATALEEIDFNPSLQSIIPFTRQDRFMIRGTNFPRTRVRVSHAFGNVDLRSDSAGRFSLAIPLEANEQRDYFISGYSASGARLHALPMRVERDSTAPTLQVHFPFSDWITDSSRVAISGQVRDVNGFRGMAVRIHGVATRVFLGDGSGGTFLGGPIALSMGRNVISLQASDVVGNTISKNILVNRVAASGFRMEKVIGDLQEGRVGHFLQNAVAVKVIDPRGQPMVGKPVRFEILGGVGSIALSPFSRQSESLISTSNAFGVALVRWRLGRIAGRGNHLLRVSSHDVQHPLIFLASALPTTDLHLHPVSGDRQVALVDSIAPKPLRLWVHDGSNAIAGKQIEFEVIEGEGTLNGKSRFTTRSGAGGFAETYFRMGHLAGPQRIAVRVVGETKARFEYALNAIEPNLFGKTTLRGMLLTPRLRPVRSARIEAMVEGTRFGPILSNGAGEFRFAFISNFINEGAAEVQIWLPEGNTSQATASKPLVRKNLFLIAGAENVLPSPIILPMTKHRRTFAFDGSTDLLLPLDGNPGFSLLLPAGGVQSLDGTSPSPESPFEFSLTQVVADCLPRLPNQGEVPRIAWLLEPADIELTLPSRIVVPDLAGLSGSSFAGLFGMISQKPSFGRRASLGARGAPPSFEFRQSGLSGFAFVNDGYQEGRAVVASSPPIQIAE